ncbi:MAG: enoyl-CoA hydratase-related protein [Myxococcota bacterium]
METLRLHYDGPIAYLTLCRPAVHNAFNQRMLEELEKVFDELAPQVRMVVMTGEGASFCAGADVAWMKASATGSAAENTQGAARMAALFRRIDETPQCVIGRINGATFGGGVGLVACCDVVVAASTARFSMSEVRLGLVPAVVSAFILPKIGVSQARRYFLTGERFGAEQAASMGLVHKVVAAEKLDAAVEYFTDAIFKCAPGAVGEAKRLIRQMGVLEQTKALEYASQVIADLRASQEGQEGLAAFLEKRPAAWASKTPNENPS